MAKKSKSNKKLFVALGVLLVLLIALVSGAYYMYVKDVEAASSTYNVNLDTTQTATGEVVTDGITDESELSIDDTVMLSYTLSDGTVIRISTENYDPQTQGIIYLVDPQYDENTKIFIQSKTVSEVPYIGIYNIGQYSVDITYAAEAVYTGQTTVIADTVTELRPTYDKTKIINAAATTEQKVSSTTSEEEDESEIYTVIINVTPKEGSEIIYNGWSKGISPVTLTLSKGEYGTLIITNDLYDGQIEASVPYNAGTMNFNLDTDSRTTLKQVTEASEDKEVEGSEEVSKHVEDTLENIGKTPDQLVTSTPTITFQSNVAGTKVSLYNSNTGVIGSTIGTTSSGTPSTFSTKQLFATVYVNSYTVIATADGYKPYVVTIIADKDKTVTLKLEKAVTVNTGIGSTTEISSVPSGYYPRSFQVLSSAVSSNGRAMSSYKGKIIFTSSEDIYYVTNGEIKKTRSFNKDYDGMTSFSPLKDIFYTKAGQTVNYQVTGNGFLSTTGKITTKEAASSISTIYVDPIEVVVDISSFTYAVSGTEYRYAPIISKVYQEQVTGISPVASISDLLTGAVSQFTRTNQAYFLVESSSSTSVTKMNNYKLVALGNIQQAGKIKVKLNDQKKGYVYILACYPYGYATPTEEMSTMKATRTTTYDLYKFEIDYSKDGQGYVVTKLNYMPVGTSMLYSGLDSKVVMSQNLNGNLLSPKSLSRYF